jgi:hypothetical protein
MTRVVISAGIVMIQSVFQIAVSACGSAPVKGWLLGGVIIQRRSHKECSGRSSRPTDMSERKESEEISCLAKPTAIYLKNDGYQGQIWPERSIKGVSQRVAPVATCRINDVAENSKTPLCGAKSISYLKVRIVMRV